MEAAKTEIFTARLKAERRPGGDGIARLLLNWFVVESFRDEALRRRMNMIADVIVERLAAQGFDEPQVTMPSAASLACHVRSAHRERNVKTAAKWVPIAAVPSTSNPGHEPAVNLVPALFSFWRFGPLRSMPQR